MNKKAIYALVALLTISLVSAGSIEDLQYKDLDFFQDRTRTTNDNNVKINADKLNGETSTDIKNDAYDYADEVSGEAANSAVEQANSYTNEQTSIIASYVLTNEEAYLKDEDDSGASMNSIKKFLFGDFLTLLDEMFVSEEEFAVYQAKQTYTDEAQILCGAAKILADKNDEEVTIGGYTASPTLSVCVKFN